MKKRIFIEGSFYKVGGIGRYYSLLLKALSRSQKFDIVTSVPKKKKESWHAEFSGFENVLPFFLKDEKFSIRNTIDLSKYINTNENYFDWFIFTHINVPIKLPKNSIVVIHDLRPLTIWWDRSKIRKYIFRLLILQSIRRAKYIVVPSNFSKNELLSNFGEKYLNKIKVIPLTIDIDSFSSINKKNIDNFIENEYILYVGARKYHKNIQGLIKAFQLMLDSFPNLKLVIAGFKEKNNDFVETIISELSGKHKSNIIEVNYPKDEELLILYRNAKLLILPSFYEGFGFPPLEALSLGCPVLTSNIPVFVENFGEEISCLDPHSPEQMMEKISEILLSENKRQQILEIGKKLVDNFSAEKFAQNYLKILE